MARIFTGFLTLTLLCMIPQTFYGQIDRQTTKDKEGFIDCNENTTLPDFLRQIATFYHLGQVIVHPSINLNDPNLVGCGQVVLSDISSVPRLFKDLELPNLHFYLCNRDILVSRLPLAPAEIERFLRTRKRLTD